jgi:hypothetical protein
VDMKIRLFREGMWRILRMVSSGLLRRVAFVRTDVSEEPGASFLRVTKISELGTTQAATSNRRTLRRSISSSETSVLTRATRRNNPEDTILHSHRRENLKSYMENVSLSRMRRRGECSQLLL